MRQNNAGLRVVFTAPAYPPTHGGALAVPPAPATLVRVAVARAWALLAFWCGVFAGVLAASVRL